VLARRFVTGGAKAAAPYLRLRPPASERAALKPKPEPASATAETRKAAGAPAKKKPAIRRPATAPGRALTPPGLTPKDIMDASTPTLGLTAVVDAIQQHITGFEPENALEIGGFLAGLDGLFSELGGGLVAVSERLGGEHPVDSSVVEHLQQMGAHALTLADYGTQTSGLFRAAHEADLARLENPRVREEDWDVERNR
jgi:hypothetical protein